MLELMETVYGFRSKNEYPIRIDVFDIHKQWMYGIWASNDWAMGFLFETCELRDYELCKWYITKDKTQLYVVVVERKSDV